MGRGSREGKGRLVEGWLWSGRGHCRCCRRRVEGIPRVEGRIVVVVRRWWCWGAGTGSRRVEGSSFAGGPMAVG